MTAASEHGAPDRERAETYLRLQAESELRRALAMPVYKPPREFRAQRSVFLIAQARRMRRRRAMVDRLMRQQARGATAGSQSGHANPSRAAQSTAALLLIRRAEDLAKAARAIAAPPAATVLKAGTRTRTLLGAAIRPLRWQFQRRFRGHRGYQPPPAEACLTRVEAVAGVLAAVGAITAETEQDVVDGLRAALAARSRIDQRDLLSYHGVPGRPMRRRAAQTAAPSGPPRAIPVSAAANCEIEGVPARFYLGVLVLDDGGATLTVRARFPAELEEQDHGHMNPVHDALNQISAVDDRSATYRADFSGGGGGGEWDGRLRLSPVPPPGVRWLDVTLPGAPAVRVLLDAAPGDLHITTEQVTTSAADRFLDARAMELLYYSRTPATWADDDEDDDRPALFWLASHLLAAGVLTTDSTSLRRVAALAARMGTYLPAQLSLIQPDALPSDWLKLQAAAGRNDGPAGTIPVAAALPEVDGAQCVLAELISEADGATLQVLCSGWPEPRRHGMVRIEQFRWSARDDLGGRYVSEDDSWSYSDGHADLDLNFRPAINPQARALDIILTGTTRQVTVTVPLDWREGL